MPACFERAVLRLRGLGGASASTANEGLGCRKMAGGGVGPRGCDGRRDLVVIKLPSVFLNGQCEYASYKKAVTGHLSGQAGHGLMRLCQEQQQR
jgi:hypothetical protein